MTSGTVNICGRDWPFLLHENRWTLYLAEDYTIRFCNDRTVVARMVAAVERYLEVSGHEVRCSNRGAGWVPSACSSDTAVTRLNDADWDMD